MSPIIIVHVDDVKSNSELIDFLKRAGLVITICEDLETALTFCTSNCCALILTEFHGGNFINAMKEKELSVPVLVCSDIGDSVERALFLEAGIEDYFSKDIHPIEVLARIKRTLRGMEYSGRIQTQNFLIADELTVNLEIRKAYINKEPLTLTLKAYELLVYLMKNHERTVSREELAQVVWNWNYVGSGRAIDTRIHELRQSLQCNSRNPKFIETILGIGYRFLLPVKNSKI